MAMQFKGMTRPCFVWAEQAVLRHECAIRAVVLVMTGASVLLMVSVPFSGNESYAYQTFY
ncbi:hypothetical protein OS31_38300 [Dickeya oryzae]